MARTETYQFWLGGELGIVEVPKSEAEVSADLRDEADRINALARALADLFGRKAVVVWPDSPALSEGWTAKGRVRRPSPAPSDRSGLPTHRVVDRSGAATGDGPPGLTVHRIVERGVTSGVGDGTSRRPAHRVLIGPVPHLRHRDVGHDLAVAALALPCAS